jgi:hypothetical protein
VNGLAAWSIVHGFSTLWNAGVLSAHGATADDLARSVAAVLFAR